MKSKQKEIAEAEKIIKLYFKELKKEMIVLIKAIANVQLFLLKTKYGIFQKNKISG